MNPSVSVVLPVLNCERYVGQAVRSILSQTFTALELIVVDDGSSDETPNMLRAFDDPRLTVVRQPNEGVAAARNRGIGLSRGQYIAQMDADDISHPARIARQVAFLDDHSNHGMVGTWAEIWREDTKTDRVHRHPTDNVRLKFELLFDNPFVQSSVMVRRDILDRVGLYSVDPARQPPEDYELWSRIARISDIANIGDVLLVYREVKGSISRLGATPFLENLVALSAENIGWAAGVGAGSDQVRDIAAFMHGAFEKVSGEPDYDAMRLILGRAVARVAGGQSTQYEREAADRLSARLVQYSAALNGRGRRRPVGRPWRLIRSALRGRQ